jgi:hypothetical protein
MAPNIGRRRTKGGRGGFTILVIAMLAVAGALWAGSYVQSMFMENVKGELSVVPDHVETPNPASLPPKM